MSNVETTTLSLDRYRADARALVSGAQALADERHHVEMQPLHLLALALARHSGVMDVFRRAVPRYGQFVDAVERALDALPASKEPAYLSSAMLDLLERAERERERDRVPLVHTGHLLNALSQEIRGPAGELLGAYGVGPGSLRPHLRGLENFEGSTASPRAEEARDLVAEAKANEGDPVIGRDAELNRLMAILKRRDKNHPLIVGEPGVGKRALVRGLAQRISSGKVPERLLSTQLTQLDTSALLAGARLRSDVEARFRRLANEAERGEEVVWVIDGIEQFFSSGTQYAQLGELLRPVIERGRVRLLATTTPDGVRQIEEKSADILRSFVELPLEEPSEGLAIEIVRGVSGRIEAHHALSLQKEAVQASVRLAKRYLQERFLPESALDLLDEAAATKRVELYASPQGDQEAAAPLELTPTDVAQTLMHWTGIPVQKMLQGEAEKLLQMEAGLSQRVVGQTQAVEALSRAVRRGRVGLRDHKKPIGSFLFLGPSGVGKTELAKALAHFLFDDEQALTRLDMSEFMERHMAQRLIGAPPGYADSDQGGFLTEAVRRRPFSVLLFDEVEKAHQDVFNLLLQVLDDGQLTDGRGRRADFSNTVVIMTSNIGGARILDTEVRLFESEEGREAIMGVIENELAEFFRPEFLNRIDDILIFQPLSREVLGHIVDIELVRIENMLSDRRIRLRLSPEAKRHLADAGYAPALGARPLKRAMLSELLDPLSDALLRGTFSDGIELLVDLANDELVFRRGPAQ